MDAAKVDTNWNEQLKNKWHETFLQGAVPIVHEPRVKPLKWLFVMTQGSSQEYIEMMMVAVESAIHNSGW